MKGLLHKSAINALAISALIAVVGGSANAAQLTPEQALQMLNAGGHRVAAVNGKQLRLAYTRMDLQNSAPAVYVFDRENAPGFRIVAADDCIGDILLGYSDTENFDANNIPEGLQWLMGAYAQYISQSATQPMQARANASYNAVEPIVKTKWDQDAPYNNMCPQVDGARSVTGCVATAMAQVMKVHNYPAKGTGSNSYSWQYNNKTYSLNTDFASHTYAWTNMANTYSNFSTNPQKEAVAQLMADCGAAANMTYSPYESGAYSGDAGVGLIKYFDYDKSMRYYKREWFTAQEWSDLLYAQMRQGTPVLFSGTDYEGGHEFVLDGCDATGMFHVNWGWGGLADGYYSLTDLTPTETGIGAGMGSYNMGQDAIIDIKPNANGAAVPAMSVMDQFAFDKTSYNGNNTTVKLQGLFVSYNLVEQNVELGLKMVTTSGAQYQSLFTTSLSMLQYFPELTLLVGNFPEGEYDLSPAYRTPGGQWQDMYFDEPTSPRAYHVTKSGTKLTIGNASGSGEDPVEEEITAELEGIYGYDGEQGIYPGHIYDFVYNVTAPSACSYNVITAVVNESAQLVDFSDFVDMTFTAAGTKEVETPYQIDPALAPGKYYFCLAYVDDEYNINPLTSFYGLNVVEDPSGEIVLSAYIDGIYPYNQNDDAVYAGHKYDFSYNVSASGACEADLYVLMITSDNKLYDYSDPTTATFTAVGTQKVNVPFEIYAGAPAGKYQFVLATLDGDTFNLISGRSTVEVNEAPALEAEFDAEFFGFAPVDDADEGFYAGHSYLFGYHVTSTAAADVTFYAVLIDEENYIKDMSEGVFVSFAGAETKDVITTFNFDEDLELGRYYLGLVYIDKGGYMLASDLLYLDIEEPVIAATSVTLSESVVDLTVGETVQLTATVGPDDATDKTVVWTSSDETVATVDNAGLVTTHAKGTATITATCGEVSATCVINVLSTQGICGILNGITYQVVGNQLIVNGLADGETYALFNVNGTLVYAGNSSSVPLAANTVYVLSINGQSVKIAAAK